MGIFDDISLRNKHTERVKMIRYFPLIDFDTVTCGVHSTFCLNIFYSSMTFLKMFYLLWDEVVFDCFFFCLHHFGSEQAAQ